MMAAAGGGVAVPLARQDTGPSKSSTSVSVGVAVGRPPRRKSIRLPSFKNISVSTSSSNPLPPLPCQDGARKDSLSSLSSPTATSPVSSPSTTRSLYRMLPVSFSADHLPGVSPTEGNSNHRPSPSMSAKEAIREAREKIPKLPPIPPSLMLNRNNLNMSLKQNLNKVKGVVQNLPPVLRHRSSSTSPMFAGSSSANASHEWVAGGGGKTEVIFGRKLPLLVPNRDKEIFGVSLEVAVERSRLVPLGPQPTIAENGPISSPSSAGSNFGDTLSAGVANGGWLDEECRKWLPAIAIRCLEYLEVWGEREEGIYRVPGRSGHVSKLREVFNAGIDLDLLKCDPADLDPHAVASLFKTWLRELPESILSSSLDSAVDTLVLSYLGTPALSTNLVPSVATPTRSTFPISPNGNGPLGSTSPLSAANMENRITLVTKLKELWGGGMPAENYYLLRALAHHLNHLSQHANQTKMTLSNLLLILSPTLRVTPSFLKFLILERDMLFSRTCETAKIRETSWEAEAFGIALRTGNSVHSDSGESIRGGARLRSPLERTSSRREKGFGEMQQRTLANLAQGREDVDEGQLTPKGEKSLEEEMNAVTSKRRQISRDPEWEDKRKTIMPGVISLPSSEKFGDAEHLADTQSPMEIESRSRQESSLSRGPSVKSLKRGFEGESSTTNLQITPKKMSLPPTLPTLQDLGASSTPIADMFRLSGSSSSISSSFSYTSSSTNPSSSASTSPDASPTNATHPTSSKTSKPLPSPSPSPSPSGSPLRQNIPVTSVSNSSDASLPQSAHPKPAFLPSRGGQTGFFHSYGQKEGDQVRKIHGSSKHDNSPTGKKKGILIWSPDRPAYLPALPSFRGSFGMALGNWGKEGDRQDDRPEVQEVIENVDVGERRRAFEEATR